MKPESKVASTIEQMKKKMPNKVLPGTIYVLGRFTPGQGVKSLTNVGIGNFRHEAVAVASRGYLERVSNRAAVQLHSIQSRI